MSRLDRFLRPGSIAVVGASRKEGSLGHMFLNALLEMKYTGRIIPVNPKANELNGVPCVPEISALPDNVDMAVVLLPYSLVETAVESLAARGIKNQVIVSAGFREVGGEGAERERRLKKLAADHDCTLIGPNCMGVFNTDPSVSMNATFSPTPPEPGGVAFISQSGALGVAVLELSVDRGLGFSVFVSTGNKIDTDEVDALEFLADDENTRVVMMYLESIDRPREFMRACRNLKKPVVVVKAGRGEKAMQAASSHTGALASPDRIVDAFLRQCGVIRCRTLEEMLDVARALDQLPLIGGPGIAVVSNAGGPLILAADALEQEGLEIPFFSGAVQERLRAFLPEESAVRNPVDMIASATHDTYRRVLEVVAEVDEVHGILMIVVKPPVKTSPREVLESIHALLPELRKPLVAVVMQQDNEDAGLDLFRKHRVPVYPFPESAVKVLSCLLRYSKMSVIDRGAPLPVSRTESVIEGTRRQLPVEEVFRILESFGIPVARHVVTESVAEAVHFADQDTVVMKNANREIIHKSDAGLVCLGIRGEEQIKRSFVGQVEKAKPLLKGVEPRVLVQEMVEGFPELSVGATRDPVYGPVVMFGLGGILVEALKDVAFRVAPIDESTALDMIGEIRAGELLDGPRGYRPVDRTKLVEILTGISRLMMERTDVSELDLNPVIWAAGRSEAVVVDARMTLLS